MDLETFKTDCAVKQKKGLHFILASVLIWSAVTAVHLTSLPILTKNLFTFFCTAPLMPLSYLISRLLKIDFRNEGNPLSNLGLLFSLNQLLYLLIAMWVFPTVPEKMLMVIAMIFGAHLLPYAWLYTSRSYLLFAIVIPFAALLIGTQFSPAALGGMMIGAQILFSGLLLLENKQLGPAPALLTSAAKGEHRRIR